MEAYEQSDKVLSGGEPLAFLWLMMIGQETFVVSVRCDVPE
jgi:hypothetical protein